MEEAGNTQVLIFDNRYWAQKEVSLVKEILTSSLILFSILMVSTTANAQDTNVRKLSKKNIHKIKIFSTKADQIDLYIKDHEENTYRVDNVTFSSANKIINQIGSDEGIQVQTTSHKNGYHLVTEWQ